MNFRRTAVSEWAWAGGPFRRFLLSLAATAVIVAVSALARSPTPGYLITLFLGFDLGAWFMDKIHVDRLRRPEPVTT